MVFYLNTDAVLKIRNPGYVDYLDEHAMDTFLSMSYEKFYAHLKEYFGSVIKMAFMTNHPCTGSTVVCGHPASTKSSMQNMVIADEALSCIVV